jgi:very-short-patch-repair endonuclease
MHNVIYLFIVLAVVGVMVAILKKFLPKGKGLESPYQKEPTLFTPAERSFLGVLEQALGNEFRIMGKVRLADVLKVKPGLDGSARQRAFNKIQSKHLDFVACDPNDLSIQFAVELDDKSHDRSDRQNRDAFLDQAMEKAGLPIIRFAVKKGYSVQEIHDTIASRLNQGEVEVAEVVEEVSPAPANSPVQVPAVKQTPDAPQCTACGGQMVRRKASKGANAGNEFWGCSNYPKCKQILAA